MPTYRNFVSAFRTLGIERPRPVIAHVSLSAFGEVHGGEQTMLGALLASFEALLVPTFTYKTMVVPEVGPPDNGIEYGKSKGANMMAEFFHPDMPADRQMGVVAEVLRRQPSARRSTHPILSFAGVHVETALDAQSLDEPFLPIHALKGDDGWVLMMGVDHTVNTSIHYAEWIAGRKQFVRWALTPSGVVECKGWPGCSQGFQMIAPRLEGVTRVAQVGPALIQAIPLTELVDAVVGWINVDPLALLCEQEDCERCNAVRASVTSVTE